MLKRMSCKAQMMAANVCPPATVSAACFIVGPISFAIFLTLITLAMAVLWVRA